MSLARPQPGLHEPGSFCPWPAATATVPRRTRRDVLREAAANAVASRPSVAAPAAAVELRLGLVEGQLDMARRLLTDGGMRERELRERAERLRKAREQVERRLRFEAMARRHAEQELNGLRERLPADPELPRAAATVPLAGVLRRRVPYAARPDGSLLCLLLAAGPLMLIPLEGSCGYASFLTRILTDALAGRPLSEYVFMQVAIRMTLFGLGFALRRSSLAPGILLLANLLCFPLNVVWPGY